MSVPLSQRSESSIEFLALAYEIERFFLKIVVLKPRKYKAVISEWLFKESATLYSNLVAANSVPLSKDKNDYDLRRRYFQLAEASLQKIVAQTQVFYDICNADGLTVRELQEISEKMYKLNDILQNMIKQEKEQFGKRLGKNNKNTQLENDKYYQDIGY